MDVFNIAGGHLLCQFVEASLAEWRCDVVKLKRPTENAVINRLSPMGYAGDAKFKDLSCPAK